MGHHKKYIYRKKHPVLIRSNIIHTYLDQSQSRCLVKCHSRNTDQCIFGKLSVKLFAEMWGSRGKFWGLFCRIGIYSHIPHCLCLLPANSIFNRRPSWNCNKISEEKKFNNIFGEEKNLKDVNRSFSLIAWEQWAIKDRWKVSMVPRWLYKWWWWWRRRWNGWFDVKQMSRGTFRDCKWGKDRWMEGWMIMMMMNYHGFGYDDDDDDDNRHSYKCFGNDWTVWMLDQPLWSP